MGAWMGAKPPEWLCEQLVGYVTAGQGRVCPVPVGLPGCRTGDWYTSCGMAPKRCTTDSSCRPTADAYRGALVGAL